ncbi:MAG: hypothetical protein NXI24_03210 [bacterium]|nr:hypothetical protein [bacterium]
MATYENNFAKSSSAEKAEAPSVRSKSADVVLQAFRLGYLAVESYSRLKSPINRKPKPPKADADSRFGFTEPSDESKYYQIFRTAGQFHAQAQQLGLPKPPMPLNTELRDRLAAGLAPEKRLELHGQLDDWGRDAELQLSLIDEEAARAFAYGGSFALTYWAGHGIASDQQPKEYGRSLRSYRIRHTIERLESLREHLPEYWIETVRHSLQHWAIGERVAKMDRFNPDKSGLEGQMTIWRDTLFGRRPPEIFLNLDMRNRVQRIAYLSTTALVIVGLCAFWTLLWSVPALMEQFRLGGWLMESLRPTTQYIQTELPITVDSKLDSVIKAASALVATVSSVAVFLAGMISRASGWILRLHRRVDFYYRSRAIQKRTTILPSLTKAEEQKGARRAKKSAPLPD